ncbi:MAG: ribosomal protein S18 acetylase RimI-like enzyme [Desulforhopalus sp.]|jgi:ribosomal protein S18 acetylase RimI-like enzyme
MAQPMIRRATREDIQSLIPLLRLLFSIEEDFSFDAKKQQKGLTLLIEQGSAAIFIAEYNGETVGMVTGQLLISTAEGGPALVVEDLVVDPHHRNKKIARYLLQALGNWAEERGAHRMQLLADTSNKEALSFYKKCGWTQTKLICLRKYYKEQHRE